MSRERARPLWCSWRFPLLPDHAAVYDIVQSIDPAMATLAQLGSKRYKEVFDLVHFHGLRYLDPVLAAYVGDTVVIRYDPRDMAEIRVFTGTGFLCRAWPCGPLVIAWPGG